MNRKQNQSHRLRDFLLYIVIGFAFVLAAILLVVHQAQTGQRVQDFFKWVHFAVLTLLVFWWTVRSNRVFLMEKRFWRFLGAFAVIHVALGISILVRVEVVSLLPFMIATPLEMFLVSAYFHRVLGPR